MNSIRYRIEIQGLAKQFGRNLLFKNLNFTVDTGSSFCITGPNGSGKTTLLNIIAGLMKPSTGTVTYTDIDLGSIIRDRLPFIGYAGPLVNPYEDLTALENIKFSLKKYKQNSNTDFLFNYFNLNSYKDMKIRYYSTGMKQRLRIILADLNDPPVLLLDEPNTNLDERGRGTLHSYLASIVKKKIIILATNDSDEEKLFNGGIRLG
jgi:ABC-type multidrug transport system ATPase subunit